ncbi:MAG: DUF1127 domain-containing protein [Roseivivax sp.]|nr:DUF1127 domain-containing protein [Roseivivax sp.]
MAHTTAAHASLLAYLDAHRTLTPSANVALRMAVVFHKWAVRQRTRRQLGMLDDHILKDIGMDRRIAFTEARRKFWQG